MTWALSNDHLEVVREPCWRRMRTVSTSVDDRAREEEGRRLSLALEKGGAKPETLTAALVAATWRRQERRDRRFAEKGRRGSAAGGRRSDVAVLRWKYKGDPGPEVSISFKDGGIFVAQPGQPPLALMAVDQITFKPAAFDGITIIFKVESGKVTSFDLKQGKLTLLRHYSNESKKLNSHKSPVTTVSKKVNISRSSIFQTISDLNIRQRVSNETNHSFLRCSVCPHVGCTRKTGPSPAGRGLPE